MAGAPILLPFNLHGGLQPLDDEPNFPDNGMAPRVADRVRPLSPFGRIAKAGPLGKSTILRYDDVGDGQQNNPPSVVQVRGADVDATQMSIVLTAPQCIPTGIADIPLNKYGAEDVQNAGGGYTNLLLGNRVIPGEATACRWPQFLARIRWGVEGAVAEALVDWVNGAVVNVHASSVDVDALIAPEFFDAAALTYPATSGLYQVSAFVTPGWPRPGSAQRTIFVGTLSSESSIESTVFAVPAFAKSVTAISASPTVPAPAGIPSLTVCYVNFFADADGQVAIASYLVNANQPGPFRVPAGAEYFTIVSGMDATAQRFAAVFELAI